MSNQPRPLATAVSFERDEWELIVTLPRRVLMAAVASAPADGRAAAEGIAGIEAIASGLASRSQLVREVVSAIYSEAIHADAMAATPPAGDEDGEPTLAACRYATDVLAQRVDPEDAGAYRVWLLHIAAVVSGVAQGVAGPVRVGLAEARPASAIVKSRFLHALGGVLRP